MNIQSLVIKLSCISLLGLGLTACSMLPSMDGVFIDQKEEYKKAYELPELEMPTELTAGSVKDEYDGGSQKSTPKRNVAVNTEVSAVTIPNKDAVVKTTPLADEQPYTELVKKGVNIYLLVRDSMRNTWRKTINTLEKLSYDIEDKNRQQGKIYLNIAQSSESTSLLSVLSFWSKVKTTVYVVALDHKENDVNIRVLSEEKGRVDDDVTRDILSDLSKLEH